MKKIFVFICLFMLNACIVNAETFYINKNGSELTKQQYDYLIQYYDYDFLDNMKKETLDDIKNWNDDSIEKNEKYILIDTYYDFFGNVLNSSETVVDAVDVPSILKSSMLRATSDTHTTTMKKITLTISRDGTTGNYYSVLTNLWLGIPKVKSNDVIALRFVGATNKNLSIVYSMSEAHQFSDNTNKLYSICPQTSCSETKLVHNNATTGGVGVSMDIYDSTSSSLKNTLAVYVRMDSSFLVAEGTYQHATKIISLANSKKYSFSATGLGNVLNFQSNYGSYYDGMQGVSVRYN